MTEEPDQPQQCPSCGGPLTIESTHGVRRYSCAGCGGLMCGVVVFRALAGADRAAKDWQSAVIVGDYGTGGRCPFCGIPMKASPPDHGRIWACKTCEMVWVDKDALASFAASTPAPADDAAPPAPAGPTHCANCGAPIQHEWDDRCEFCGAALAPATKVVVIDSGTAEPAPATGKGIWQTVGEMLGGDVQTHLPHGWWREL